MKKILNKALHLVVCAYESLIPDEETARRIGESYVAMYKVK